ncbi:MAG: OFA family MFS transporter [Candidatus Hydrogenedentes bacterium]|nr:OFA family MFS transporter [Candidatus Hydrogenedentota bacterium]
MTEQNTQNRWIVVVGALIVQVSLGAVYIWSVFQTPLKAVFPTWSEAQVTYPSQIVLAAFALAVIIGGRIQDKLGPRIVGITGGALLGLGLILAKFTQLFASSPDTALIWLILTFSVIGGIGIGFGYVCPIATCVKWFPDKRGLITGLAVAGFGAGAFFFAPLAKALISGGYYELMTIKLFSLPAIGVFNTFLTLGIIFLIAVVLGSSILKNPPAGYCPPGWTPPKPSTAGPTKVDYSPTEMLATPVFWILWLTYFAGCAAGLQIIMKASPIWQSFAIPLISERPIPADIFNKILTQGAMAVSLIAIFNAVGRIFWGKVSDNIGRKSTLFIMFIICGIAMLLLNSLKIYPLYILGVGTVGLCFGGYLALYPAVIADFYGTKNMGVNYGWMFTAYGAGGLAGPYLAAVLMKSAEKIPYLTNEGAKEIALGSYSTAFLVCGIACLVAGGLILTVQPPKAK